MKVCFDIKRMPFRLFVKPEHEGERNRCRRLKMRYVAKLKVYTTSHLEVGEEILAGSQVSMLNFWETETYKSEIQAGATGLAPGGFWFDPNLYPFQQAGAKELLNRRAVLLADEMGLGKTVQVASMLEKLSQLENFGSVLIVCPAGVKSVWLKELKIWTRFDDSNIYTVIGRKKLLSSNRAIYVMNYDLLTHYEDWLYKMPWAVIVLDEAHYLKNTKAQRTRVALGDRVRKGLQAPKKIALTGTPVVNRPSELYPILRWLDPDGWPRKWDYLKRYCDAHRGHFGWDTTGASNLSELQQRLKRTVLIRRMKRDVLPDLPPKIRQIIELDPDTKTRRLLQTEQQLINAGNTFCEISELPKLSSFDFEQLMCGLQKQKIAFIELSEIRHQLAIAKLPLVIEHLETCLAGGQKVVCFVHHRDVYDAIRSKFENCSTGVCGGLGSKARDRAVARFQLEPSVSLFVGNMVAAGIGITLTAASHVVFAELSWVPGELTQAEDRCHRIGTVNSVLVQHLVVSGSVDARMAQLVIEKQKVIEKVMG